MSRESARAIFMELVDKELSRAYHKHGVGLWGRHEFYGILKEEVDELWDDIKRDAPNEQMLKELVQVAAMCIRFAETGNRYSGSHEPDLEKLNA